VPSARAPEGFLYVVLRGEEFDSAEQQVLESYTFQLSAWAVAGSLGFGLLAGLLLFYRLTRRLQRLSLRMSEFRDSGFNHYQAYAGKAVSGDEIEYLGAVFDGMAERIMAQIAQLKEQDRLRRQLVAQISHDLRTPLASIHGYLETLDMRGTLSDKERKQYLQVALRQSGRLTRMIDELFELARLEARDTQARREVFPPAELVQDVVQKFQARAAQCGIQLSMAQPPAAAFVLADLGLTERVLDNLIGNAIDHSPRGTQVLVSLAALAQEVLIGVCDQGPGIADEDLARIFEPFHRGQGASKEKGHAGLGLAIAKRIVEMQHGALHVHNKTQGGACFSFTLPYSDEHAAL
jgi:signal transduction histidine kinase